MASKMAQRVQEPAARSHGLGSILVTLTVEEENQLLQVDLHMHTMACVPPITN